MPPKKRPQGSSSRQNGTSGDTNTEFAKRFVELAAKNGVAELAKMLETPHVNQEILNKAFMAASEMGHSKVLSLLFRDGRVKAECSNNRGETGLFFAARNGHVGVTVTLLNKGADIDARNNDGITPLFAAVEYNQEEMAALILERKANVNATDNKKNTVLHVAAANGLPHLVALILRTGADTNARNDKQESPLEVAKTPHICRIILEYHSGYEPPAPTSLTGHLPVPVSPFRELPPGPASYLFWTAMGVGKDSYMFQNFGVFPFDRLNDTERIIVLTEVAEAMSGYKTDLQCNVLNESALYAVFALMKARIRKELDDGEKDTGKCKLSQEAFLWRKRVLEAYEQVYATTAVDAGLSAECWKQDVWFTVVNLLARSLFGESFWDKETMFNSANSSERRALLSNFMVPSDYFNCRLPSTASIEIQLTFKKLITMSKTFLCDEPVRPSGCFCQDCIAELEVPLTFKLQFLEEAAEEKRKIKKGRKGKDKKAPPPVDQTARKIKLHEVIAKHRQELKNFWSSISIEEKWCLTEMSTSELQDIISRSEHWETLRGALESYAKYAWEEDVLEITEDCVTIADDMCEEKGMHDMLEAMLDAVGFGGDLYSFNVLTQGHLTEDEWDKNGRQLLENLVLAEFARKIAAQYLLRKEESRAQQVALELELELLQEEQQRERAAERKAKKKSKKNKKKKKKKDDAAAAAEKEAQKADANSDTKQKSEKNQPDAQDASKSKAKSTGKAENAEPQNSKRKGKKGGDKEEPAKNNKKESGKKSKGKNKNGNENDKKKKKKGNAEKKSNANANANANATAANAAANAAANKANGVDEDSESSDDESWVAAGNPFAMLTAGSTSPSHESSQSRHSSKIGPNAVAGYTQTPALQTSAMSIKPAKQSKKRDKPAEPKNPPQQQPAPSSKAKPTKEKQQQGRKAAAPVVSMPPAGRKAAVPPAKAPAAAPQSAAAVVAAQRKPSVPMQVAKKAPATWYDHYEDGMMFICTKDTYKECLERKLLGLPRQHMRVVRALKPRTSALFLFNVSDRHLHGVFEATCAGQENINPAAWAKDKSYQRQSSPFPAQIEFKIMQRFEPLAESAFRHVFTDGNRIRKLDGKNVRDLIQIFLARTRSSATARGVQPKKKSVVRAAQHNPRVVGVARSVAPAAVAPKAPVKNVWKLRQAEAAKAASAKAVTAKPQVQQVTAASVAAAAVSAAAAVAAGTSKWGKPTPAQQQPVKPVKDTSNGVPSTTVWGNRQDQLSGQTGPADSAADRSPPSAWNNADTAAVASTDSPAVLSGATWASMAKDGSTGSAHTTPRSVAATPPSFGGFSQSQGNQHISPASGGSPHVLSRSASHENSPERRPLGDLDDMRSQSLEFHGKGTADAQSQQQLHAQHAQTMQAAQPYRPENNQWGTGLYNGLFPQQQQQQQQQPPQEQQQQQAQQIRTAQSHQQPHGRVQVMQRAPNTNVISQQGWDESAFAGFQQAQPQQQQQQQQMPQQRMNGQQGAFDTQRSTDPSWPQAPPGLGGQTNGKKPQSLSLFGLNWGSPSAATSDWGSAGTLDSGSHRQQSQQQQHQTQSVMAGFAHMGDGNGVNGPPPGLGPQSGSKVDHGTANGSGLWYNAGSAPSHTGFTGLQSNASDPATGGWPSSQPVHENNNRVGPLQQHRQQQQQQQQRQQPQLRPTWGQHTEDSSAQVASADPASGRRYDAFSSNQNARLDAVSMAPHTGGSQASLAGNSLVAPSFATSAQHEFAQQQPASSDPWAYNANASKQNPLLGGHVGQQQQQQQQNSSGFSAPQSQAQLSTNSSGALTGGSIWGSSLYGNAGW